MANESRKRFTINGQVQGVGFRPFVYRLATELGLTGWVQNDSSGVTIEVQGDGRVLGSFARRLGQEVPPLAKIGRCLESPAQAVAGESGFTILPSAGGEMADAQVTVDVATCPDCLREMNDPKDPRYQYPFINCTNCGPRYSIVQKIPYDRANTVMSDFAMCPLCGGEYRDPLSRRFHAQPVACPKCGPSVWLVDTRGKQIHCQDSLTEAASWLCNGRVLAIKGLGGFHLACRADDQHVVSRLRHRKRRDAKPFAVMVADLDQARVLCQLNAVAEDLLTGPIRPIVLALMQPEIVTAAALQAGTALPAPQAPPPPAAGSETTPPGPSGDEHPWRQIAPAVACGLSTLGILLPYTPLHHLLFARMASIPRPTDLPQGALWPPPLVMTSGNYSEEPLVKDNDSAIAHLGQIADAILLHNRRIERRIDDSVVQIHADGKPSILRRGRGYAPQPVSLTALGTDHPPVLAVGSELKSAVCLLKGDRAVLSEHIGDLKDGRVYRHFIDTIHHLEQLFDVTPSLIVADLHPQYLSTEYALRRWRGELAGRTSIPIIRVQHHHAHIASCLLENGRTGPVIGIAADGVGHGDDGAAWGCEILQADLLAYQRLGHLRYVHMPGGDAASKDCWRPALAVLYDTFGESCPKVLANCKFPLPAEQVKTAMEMLEMGVNSPPTSSLGRWFDAVAWMCGLAQANRFEGEAAMTLESAARGGVTDTYAFKILADGPFLIDLRPMVEGIVGDLSANAEVDYIAARFHNTVARFLAAAAQRAAEQTGIKTVALSGGCFANRYLTAAVARALEGAKLEVLRHHLVPCNDGGVALGQAAIAAARKEHPAISGSARDGDQAKGKEQE